MKNLINIFYREVPEGDRAPLFFLPVRACYRTLQYEYWLVIIAPVVIALYIIANVFISIWMDLNRLLVLLKRKTTP